MGPLTLRGAWPPSVIAGGAQGAKDWTMSMGREAERARRHEGRPGGHEGRDGREHAHGEARFPAIEDALHGPERAPARAADGEAAFLLRDFRAQGLDDAQGSEPVVASEGLPMAEVPAARRAAASARPVMLFEGGAATTPLTAEGVTYLIPYPFGDLLRHLSPPC